jgi:error-prone DNA polymerase
MGLGYAKGLRRQSADALVAFRHQNGPFRSAEDIALRIPSLNRKELTLLAPSINSKELLIAAMLSGR